MIPLSIILLIQDNARQYDSDVTESLEIIMHSLAIRDWYNYELY